jgi:hypothetical protein
MARNFKLRKNVRRFRRLPDLLNTRVLGRQRPYGPLAAAVLVLVDPR